MGKSLALVAARVITLDEARPQAEAVLVVDGRIAVVGSTAEVLAARGPATEVIDLRGRALLPGFIDTHVHLMATGLARTGVSLHDCRSLGEVLARVRAAAGQRVVRAIGFDPASLAEGRFPTRRELDEVAPHVPAYLIRRDMHSAALNSRALELLALPPDTPGYGRDPTTGEPTGDLRGEAWYRASLLLFNLVDANTWRQALRAAVAEALSVGATTVHALEGGFTGADADLAVLADYMEQGPRAGEKRLKIVFWWQTMDVARARERGLRRVGGCVLVDGSLGSHTAALREPYADRPDASGVLYLADDELERLIGEAHAAGMQVAVHAIGDRAIDQALRTFRKVLVANPRADHRHRIEHFLLPAPEHVRLAAELGIHVGVQPTFCAQWGGENGMYSLRLGERRRQRLLPLRSLLAHGVALGGGSDSTVTPLHPLLGVEAAVADANPQERLTVLEAVRLFTLDAARLSFEEGEKGSVTPGKAGDLVVLGASPLEVAPREIGSIPVEMTIVDGEVCWP